MAGKTLKSTLLGLGVILMGAGQPVLMADTSSVTGMLPGAILMCAGFGCIALREVLKGDIEITSDTELSDD